METEITIEMMVSIARLVRDNKKEEALVAIEELVIRQVVEAAFLGGPLDWINHPERVLYDWKKIGKNKVVATADYDKRYGLKIDIPSW